jgi:predicted O-methyltransferase YrrM
VEVGTWKGRSAAFMAVEIALSGRAIDFDCVDTWEGSLNEQEHQLDQSVKEGRLYEEFLSNMEPVIGYFHPIRMRSTEAAKLYPDHSLDFVFIDAQHDYESVCQDIDAWLPKIRQGGVIAGHDYNHDGDWGVGRAVRERFKDFETPSWCWLKRL